MKKKKHDWDALKAEFVTGDISASELAKSHGINKGTLYRHYQIERWNDARREYRERVMEKCADNAACMAAIKLAKEIQIADKLSDVLQDAIDDEKQFYRYIVKEKNGSDSGEEERIFGKMDMQSFTNAIKALTALQEVKCAMYGILSPLEERKLSSGRESITTDEESGQTGVVMLPPVEDE